MSAKLVVCGAAGRMGRLLCNLIREAPDAVLAAAVEAEGHPALGRDAGELAGGAALGVPVVADYASAAAPDTVTLDFTIAPAALAHLRTAAASGAAIVVGTTGFSEDEAREARALAAKTRTIIAANMSVGVNVLLKLVADAARLLGPAFDPEVSEVHHRMKVDAPSGTALALARAVAAASGRDLGRSQISAREGMIGKRRDEEIGVMALRGGDVVGDHTVFFLGHGERLELTHRSQSRDCLARGALRAGLWLARQTRPGLYTMADVLGLGA
ncbi:MAG: 4-hydroxy-tetrahydrodipicolinate reductase [Candidatus Binatia bacterium]